MKCEYCNNADVILKSTGKPGRFCSKKCKSDYIVKKRKTTNIERYGVDNVSKSIDILNRRNENNIKKYGVANPFSLEVFQKKQQASCIKKYGVPFATQSYEIQQKQRLSWNNYKGNNPLSDSNIRQKRELTLLERYGVKHPILNSDIKEKIEKTCEELYGYKKPTKNPIISKKISDKLSTTEIQDKIKKTNNYKYGVDHFNQIPIKNKLKLLKDPQWLQDKINKLGQTGVAVALDVSIDTVRKYVNFYKISVEYKQSAFEKSVINYLKTIYFDSIIFNSRKIIGKELDIYIPDKNIAIECNGTYWHSDLNSRSRMYHLNKTQLCNNSGIHLIHIWEHDWILKTELIKSRLNSIFNKNKKIYARNCRIELIDKKTSDNFLLTNHVQGSCSSKINIALRLLDTNQIVSIMTFGKSRFNKSCEYELLRFCSSMNYTVVGAASKLFEFFKKTYNPANIISYSDKSFNTGNLYKKLGFTFIGTSSPSYRYTRDYLETFNRIRFQKHKLKKLFPDTFDPNLSEWEIMKLNGYDRVWDCGNDVWKFH